MEGINIVVSLDLSTQLEVALDLSKHSQKGTVTGWELKEGDKSSVRYEVEGIEAKEAAQICKTAQSLKRQGIPSE